MNIESLIWKNLNAQTAIPEMVKPWLIDDQSLTHKLKRKFRDFAVNVLSEECTQPHQNEINLINAKTDYIVREVELLGDQQAVIFARSIIPITRATENLRAIGGKPLGEVLFNDSNVVRGQLQITHTGDIWGRRSTFIVGDTQLLVSEFFLENLF